MTCNFTTEQWLEIFLCHYSQKEQSVEEKQWKGEGKRRKRRRKPKGGREERRGQESSGEQCLVGEKNHRYAHVQVQQGNSELNFHMCE